MGHLYFQTAPPPTLTEAQHLSASTMLPPALPQSHHTRTAAVVGGRRLHPGSLRRQHSPGSCREHMSQYCVSEGPVPGTELDRTLASVFSNPSLHLHLSYASPNSMPSFTILFPCCLQMHQWPQAHLPSQPRAGSITSINAIIQHPQCVGAAEGWGSKLWHLAASLVPQERGGGRVMCQLLQVRLAQLCAEQQT